MGRLRVRLGRAIAVAGLIAAIGAWFWRGTPASRTGDAERDPGRADAYADNRLCLTCHLEEGRQWRASHHAQAMAPATKESVRGDFSSREFKHRGVTSRFFKRGDRFFVNTEGPSGKAADFEIKYTFGVEPLQQYLVEMPGGRLQPLSAAWDGSNRRWFHLIPNETLPPGDVLHWTGRYQTANTMCLVCHTTGFEKGYDPLTDAFASRWAEPNVSCQACHGPGERHARWETAQRGAGSPMSPPSGGPRGLSFDLKQAGGRKVLEVCAPCHSRRSELTASHKPGGPMLDSFLPSLLVQGLYHSDGQQLDEVYVDASFRQSKMFGSGVTCIDCHNAHTGKLKLAGNAVCTQCHRADQNPRFPRAAGGFDSPAHHFHKEGSKGAQCASCHMPVRTYMQVQHRPDHSIRVPRPDLSVKIGVPNACTNCHADRGPQWAADAVNKWYGPTRREGAHYGEAFAAARAALPTGTEALAQLIGNPKIPAVVRATALAELRGHPLTGAAQRIQATRDPDPEVRTAAADSMEGLPLAERVTALTPLLSDPVRAVRITAARNLSALPEGQRDPGANPAFQAALTEYIEAQNVALDMPGAQFNLGVVYENTGRRELAERHYLASLRIDPDFTPARANLAVFYSGLARTADAERVLVEGLKRRPDLGELQYSLGLLLAEDKRIKEAREALARAAKLLPGRADVHYNYGLALQQLGLAGLAERALLNAARLDPGDPSIPYALAVFYMQTGQGGKAIEWAERLQALRPTDPRVNRLIAGLRAKG